MWYADEPFNATRQAEAENIATVKKYRGIGGWESEENNWLWPLAGKSQFPHRPSVCINGHRLRSQVCTPNSPSGTGTLIYLTAPCGSGAAVSLSPSIIGLFRLYGKQTTSVKNPQISR